MRYFPILLLVTLALANCKGKPELSSAETDLIGKILEENQKVHKILFEHDTRIPSVVTLMKLSIDAKEQSVNPELTATLEEIVTDLSGTSNTDREKFDTQYSRVSEKLAKIIRTFGIKQYHEFYCPMEKRTWVSTGIKIMNPYASDMRDCGEMVQE